MSAGRICPIAYRYGAASLARLPCHHADTLYVIGGVYGNLPALAAIEAMAAAESGAVQFVFNGDFNWFNVDDASFAAVNQHVLQHHALLGNVEAEFGGDDSAGCGCAYPESVDQGIVARSNQIHAQLKQTAARHPAIRAQLAQLAMCARYQVGAARIAIVHGDADSLAGWRFDPSALDDPAQQGWLENAFQQADVDIFASSHTCQAALRRFAFTHGARVVINNGAAGMPNQRGTRHGLLTRISTQAGVHPAIHSTTLDNVVIEALAIHYDDAQWQHDFLANWPAGSAAWLSYFERINGGA